MGPKREGIWNYYTMMGKWQYALYQGGVSTDKYHVETMAYPSYMLRVAKKHPQGIAYATEVATVTVYAVEDVYTMTQKIGFTLHFASPLLRKANGRFTDIADVAAVVALAGEMENI